MNRLWLIGMSLSVILIGCEEERVSTGVASRLASEYPNTIRCEEEYWHPSNIAGGLIDNCQGAVEELQRRAESSSISDNERQEILEGVQGLASQLCSSGLMQDRLLERDAILLKYCRTAGDLSWDRGQFASAELKYGYICTRNNPLDDGIDYCEREAEANRRREVREGFVNKNAGVFPFLTEWGDHDER